MYKQKLRALADTPCATTVTTVMVFMWQEVTVL